MQLCEKRMSQVEETANAKALGQEMSWHVWGIAWNSQCGWRGVRKGKTWEVRDIGRFRYEILWGALGYQKDLAFSLSRVRPLQGF